MKKPRRNKLERERDLVLIADMYLAGVPQSEIAAKFGITQPQVSKDIAEIKIRWSNETSEDLVRMKNEEIARVNGLERTYWGAWRDSQKPKEVQYQEKISSDPELKEQEDGTFKAVPAKDRDKAALRTEGQVGNPAFLSGVQWCIERRCKMRGLDSPTKIDLHAPKPIKIIEVRLSGPGQGQRADKDGSEAAPSPAQPVDAIVPEPDLPMPQLAPGPVKIVVNPPKAA